MAARIAAQRDRAPWSEVDFHERTELAPMVVRTR